MKARTDIKPCDVFISWTKSDEAIKNQIEEYLKNKGLTCIVSDKNCSGDYKQWSEEAVRMGTVFLPIITSNTKNSTYMPVEIEKATALDDALNRIVPVVFDSDVFKSFNLRVSRVFSAEIPLKEETLSKLYDMVIDLINNRAFHKYRQAEPFVSLNCFLKAHQSRKDASVAFDKIYLPRTLEDEESDGNEQSFFDALQKGEEVFFA